MQPNHANMDGPAISSLLGISMTTFDGGERTERQWPGSLEGVGSAVVSIDQSKTGVPASHGLIVALFSACGSCRWWGGWRRWLPYY